MWRAGIPVRVGYDRVGFAPLLTHVVPFTYDDARHEREYQAAPFACLPMDRSSLDEIPDRWLHPDGSGLAVLAQHLDHPPPPRYAILHPGASTAVRDWTEDGWVDLARRVAAAGVVPVLTGLGAEQDALTGRIASAVPGGVSLCSKISWRELVALIADAQIVYCVETSVGHLAGALGVPSVGIYGGMQNPTQWKPAGVRVGLVTRDLHCSPCFRREGCAHMSCLRDITVDQVWHVGERLLQ
jgi:ADP-heptose:LPS heptosyltransferase